MPLFCASCSLILNVFSLTDIDYTACKFVKLKSTVSIYGCDLLIINKTALFFRKYECVDLLLDSQWIGPFMFQDSSGTGRCVPYNFRQVILDDSYFIFSYVCFALSTICGVITIVWLLLGVCCPLRRSHTFALQWFTMMGFLCQGSYLLVFFGNKICRAAGGCSLEKGGYYAISSAVMFFMSNLALLFIAPCSTKMSSDPSSLGRATSNNRNTIVTESVYTANDVSTEIQRVTSCNAYDDLINETINNDLPKMDPLCSNQNPLREAEDDTSNINSAIAPALCGVPFGSISFDETNTNGKHHYNN